MVGVKGKSGRHKKDCICGGCTERKAKRLMTPIQTEPLIEVEKKAEGCC